MRWWEEVVWFVSFDLCFIERRMKISKLNRIARKAQREQQQRSSCVFDCPFLMHMKQSLNYSLTTELPADEGQAEEEWKWPRGHFTLRYNEDESLVLSGWREKNGAKEGRDRGEGEMRGQWWDSRMFWSLHVQDITDRKRANIILHR